MHFINAHQIMEKKMIFNYTCAVLNYYTSPSVSLDWPHPLAETPDSLVGDVGALLEVIVPELWPCPTANDPVLVDLIDWVDWGGGAGSVAVCGEVGGDTVLAPPSAELAESWTEDFEFWWFFFCAICA